MQAPASTNALHDIKPPVEVPSGWAWVWWVFVALNAVALLLVAWRWWRGRKAEGPVPPLVPCHTRARQRLEEALGLLSQPKAFCTAVSDIIRVYLEERFTFHAPERTTEEFLQELQGTELLLPDQKDSLGEFLGQCDLVKFARYEPAELELRTLHAAAVRLIDETEPILSSSPGELLPATDTSEPARGGSTPDP